MAPLVMARTPRSIPAHAGEPLFALVLYVADKVYPRACGGTDLRDIEKKQGEGLSPRMRGNRSSAAFVTLPPGSIPAHAGEPGYKVVRLLPDGGLSPRMRGNLGDRNI